MNDHHVQADGVLQRIDSASDALTSLGRVATEHPPTYLAADRAGKYLLSAYYQGAYAAVHFG